MAKKKPAYEELNKKIKELEKELEQRKQVEKTLRESVEKWSSLVKKAQQFQPASETLFSKVFHHSPGLMTISALEDGTYLDINEKFTEVSGFSPEDVIGKTSSELGWFSPEDRKRLAEELEVQGYVSKMELTLLTKNKQQVKCLYSGEVILVDGRQRLLSIFQDIPESKQSDECLEAERSQLLSIFESIDESVYVMDPFNYKILYANRFMKDILGRDLVGGFCFKEIKGLDRPCDNCTTEIILKNKNKPIKMEFYNPNLERYYNITQRIIKWPDDRDVRLQIAIDITAHKKAEESLIKTNTLMKKTLQSLDEGVFIVDLADQKIIDCNSSFEKLSGYKKDEVVGQNIEILLENPEMCYSFSQSLYSALDIVGVFHTEYRMKRKNGEVFISDFTITDICDDSGNRSSLVGVIRDITDHKKAEHALKESEKKYRSLFNNMLSAFSYHKILFDQENNPLGSVILEVNDAWEQITGLKKDEVLGKSATDLFSKFFDRNYDWYDIVRKVVLKGEKVKFDHYNQSKDQWFSYSYYSPKKGYLAVLFEDITERKKTRNQLEKSQKQLRDLTTYLLSVREDERTRISREIHDELGQSLTALQIDLSLLEPKFNKDQVSLKKQVKSMSNSIEALVNTVQKIAGDLRPGLLDDLGLVAAIEWETEKFEERTGIECEIIIDLEDADLDGNLSTNVFRIFQETLTNVARHAGASEVKISLKEEKNELILQVVDNGRGISEEKISDSHSFGLIGIQERVRFLGGRVDILGIRNEGTSVIVSIPMRRLESAW